jgi:hypothetical protein
MFKKLLVLFLLISLGSISAQKYSGKLNPFPNKSAAVTFTGDTLRILAVMVNFQSDNDASTFGTGKFGSIYTQNYGSKILDPLPHDSSYFASHLEFAKNYFKKVSNGKLNISYNVLPDTLTVSKVMKNYTTLSTSTDFTPLGDYASEVWSLAEQHNPSVNFSGYDLFVIFHAGVGRDLTLPGSLGNEKDLPSVYLGPDALKKIYGGSFPGFGNSHIMNSLILPETENREVSNFNQTALFQITINGLITASVASFLGLPDLFDTKTGLSAIGRFGLMDGQSIFSYSGLFPPEPSAWEKIFLGWAQPVTVSPGVYNLYLTAKLQPALSDTVILKVPINSSEYFLVENRERDINGDGSILKILSDGQTITKTFTKDASGYYSFAVDSVYGVVTDVDEYDWSLPGWITDTSDYKGGILIWHIDDNVINAKIASDQINTDKTDRGVELVEANGIKIIGEKFTDIFGDLVIGEGSYEDYYYSTNPGTLYTNRFDKNSRPNSNTHSDANSLIAMSGFSNSANKMSFNLAYGDSVVKPVFANSIPIQIYNMYTIINMTSTGKRIFISNQNNLFVSDNSGNISSVPVSLSDFKPASIFIDSIDYIFGVKDSFITIARYSANSTIPILQNVNTGKILTCSPVIRTNGSQKELLVGSLDGYILIYKIDPSIPTVIQSTSNLFPDGNSLGVKSILADNDYYAALLNHTSGGTTAIIQDNQKSVTITDYIIQIALTKSHGNYTIVALGMNGGFYIISGGLIIRQIPLNNVFNYFALADLKNDGDNYIIYTWGNQVHAINLTGAEAVNFPFTNTDNQSFTGSPLTADFEGDNKSEVIAFTQDGRIFAIDGGSGKVVPGFPISTGKLILASAIYDYNGKMSLTVIDSSKHFYGWHIGSTAGTPYWVEENGNNLNNAFVSGATATNYVNEFFPKGKVYNYPNPVYNGQTAIRYYVSEDSKINIKIFDLAGDFVAELNNSAQGGYESETLWKVNNIQSGIYLARVEATGSSGKTESNIIKIAVVK